MDLDAAWEDFRKDTPIQKTSVAEKLDVIAAQLNEIQTDTKRTAEIVPKIMGDEAALDDVAELPAEPMGGMGEPVPEDIPAGVPGAEEMGAPVEEMPAPMPEGADTGDEAMGNTGFEEEPLAAEPAPTADEAPMDIPEELPEEPIPELDEAPVEEEDDLGLGDVDADFEPSGDSVSLIREIIGEEIEEGNFERAKKLLDALQAMSAEGEEFPEEEVLPEAAPMEESVEEEVVEETPAEETPEKEEKSDDEEKKEDEKVEKSDMSPMEPAAGLGEQPSAEVKESSDMDTQSVAEKIAVQVAEAAEGIVESVLDKGDTEESEGDEPEEEVAVVEIEAEPETNEEKVEAVAEHPFEECSDVKKSFSFRDMYQASLEGRDYFADIAKSTSEGDFARIDPTHSMRETFKKAIDQLSQVHPAGELITGNAPEGEDQLDQVDEEKTVSGGPESVRGSVDAPKQSGADKLDEVDEEKSKSESHPQEGDQLDDVGKTKQAHAKEGDDQLDDIDEKKTVDEGNSDKEDQLDSVNAADLKKSEDVGKPIMSFRDMMAIAKSGSRPDAGTSMNGEIVRPEPGSISKSEHSEPVRMGFGVDPWKVVEKDLAEYKAYMAQKAI